MNEINSEKAPSSFVIRLDYTPFRPRKPILFCLLLFAFCFSAVPGVLAQDDEPLHAAPPPVKYLSKDEKTVLNAENDLKKRTKLAIDLMSLRLKKAEDLQTQESFNALFNELGGFHALMDLTLIYVKQNNTGNGKSLESFKRFEIALRGFTPRLETIRRELPERYEYYVRGLLRNVRETRAKAVEPFFGETVLAGDGN
jgi:hypothetical protein